MSRILPLGLVVFSLAALVFFGVRWATDPAGRAFHTVGVAIAVVVLARNTRILLATRRLTRRTSSPGRSAAPASSSSTSRMSPMSSISSGASTSSGSAAARRPSTLKLSPPTLEEIVDAEGLEQAVAGERVVIYKHSTRCVVSSVVVDDVLQFVEAHPDWSVYLLKVIEHRDLSDGVAERFSVRHQSPQVLVLRKGRCVWHASHGDITADNLHRAVQA